MHLVLAPSTRKIFCTYGTLIFAQRAGDVMLAAYNFICSTFTTVFDAINQHYCFHDYTCKLRRATNVCCRYATNLARDERKY